MLLSRATPALRASSRQFVRPRPCSLADYQARFNSTQAGAGAGAPKKEPSNWGMVFSIAGVAGLAAYAYINRTEAQKKKAAAALPAIPGLDPKEWTSLTLEDVKKYNHNSHVFKFDFEGDDKDQKTAGLSVAGCLLVRSPTGEAQVNDDKGKPVIRPYTPVSAHDARGHIELLIKEYPTGKLTPWLSSLKPGDKVLMKGPMKKYQYQAGNFDRGVFVAGGSGITPAYQLIDYALENPEDKTKFTLLYANVAEEDILLREKWDKLAKANPDRLQVVYFLDKPPANWNGESGYVSKDKIEKYFPAKKDGEKVMAFVCGPPPQVAAVAGPKDGMKQGDVGGAFKGLGLTSEEVFKF